MSARAMERRAGARGAWVIAALALALAAGCAPVQPPGATSTAQPAPPPAAGGSPAHGGTTHAGSAAGTGHAGGAAGASSRHGVPVGNTSSGGSIVSNDTEPAVVDSGPSAEAMAVLATIPEPLSAADRVPAPGSSTHAGSAPAGPKTTSTQSGTSGTRAGAPSAGAGAASGAGVGGASGAGAGAASSAGAGAASGAGAGAASGAGAATSAGAGAAAGAAAAGGAAASRPDRPDSAAAAAADSAATTAATDTIVPVPEPTRPLGESAEAFTRAVTDTSPPPPPPPPAQAPTRSEPDSCWRIQVAAPTEKKEADLKREAAESVLLVKFEIVHEKQRYKVRNQDCLNRDAADRLRRRALQSGFTGAFPVVEVKK